MKKANVTFLSVFTFIASLSLGLSSASAQNYASLERAEAAKGHYARARTLLVEAIEEFERGRRIASPDMLLDSEEWRLNMISRTEELNRVLDPQPRVTRSGVRFRANPLLMRNERRHKPVVVPEIYDSNKYGELQRKAEMLAKENMRLQEEAAKAHAAELLERQRLEEALRQAEQNSAEQNNTDTITNTDEPSAEATFNEAEPTIVDSINEPMPQEQLVDAAPQAAPEVDQNLQEVADPVSDDISNDIEAAIRSRINRMQGDASPR